MKKLYDNPIMLTDCYNTSHQFLKVNTDWEVSHMYNRAKGMTLFGLEERIAEITNIKITKEMVEEAKEYADSTQIVFPYKMWMDVVNNLGGRLPLKIEVLPEGTWCPAGTPFMQVKNTVKGFGELVTWLEGYLMHAYFSSACATRALEMSEYLIKKDLPLNRFHSFGFRGHRSLEDAYWAGLAWSEFLPGSDDFHIAKHTQSEDFQSISALAHKVVQQFDSEYNCFKRAIKHASKTPNKVVAMVIDTYNTKRVIHSYIPKLAKMAKELGVFCVWRPDSHTDEYTLLDQVEEIYNVKLEYGLDNIATIIGEGVSFKKIEEMDKDLESRGVPLPFVSYGVGSGFYNDIKRDTLGWAMKTGFSNNAPRMKFSEVKIKESLPGELSVGIHKGKITAFQKSEEKNYSNIYNPVYKSGGEGEDLRATYKLNEDTSNYAIGSHSRFKEQLKIELSDETKALKRKIKNKHL